MKTEILSTSEDETREYARNLIQQYEKKGLSKPLVIMLSGNLGAGKTIFVKGIGDSLGIDSIISPAFVVYYEYPVKHSVFKYFYHFDLYRVDDEDEFEYLGIPGLLKKGNLICIEWSEKSGPVHDILMEKAHVLKVTINHEGSEKRRIKVTEDI